MSIKVFDNPRMAQYLGNAVYGALDGTVTTFAIIAGAIGAGLPVEMIVILALANLFADGFSMSVGSYLSERSKLDYLNKLVEEKETTIETNESEAKKEVESIYKDKGFSGKDLSRAVHIVTSKRQTYLHEILSAEGINTDNVQPLAISFITFISFVIVGTTPILPILIWPSITFIQILFFVAIILFAVGSLRSRVSSLSWWRGGIEIMVAGITASLIAYVIGEALSQTLSL